jgi:glutathione S-transferase
MAIRLFQFPTSMFCEKVRIVLARKKIPYEIVDARQNERRELIEFSRQKKVPVLDHHGQCLVDSTAISAFLDEKYPQEALYPGRPSDRAVCLIMEDWADEVLFHAVHQMRPKEPAEVQKQGEEMLQTHLRTLEQLFTEKNFVFERMTLADIAIFVELHYLYTVCKYEIPPSYKKVHAWLDRMRQAVRLSSLEDVAA